MDHVPGGLAHSQVFCTWVLDFVAIPPQGSFCTLHNVFPPIENNTWLPAFVGYRNLIKTWTWIPLNSFPANHSGFHGQDSELGFLSRFLVLARLCTWHMRRPSVCTQRPALSAAILCSLCCWVSRIPSLCLNAYPGELNNVQKLYFLVYWLPTYACRVEDYWLGYKLFCYAYYSHLIRHESEFRESKLGWWLSPICLFSALMYLFSVLSMLSWMDVWDCFLRLSAMVVLHRSTCLATSCSFPSSLPLCSPHHLHAAAPACGDVLQVGVGRGLHQSPCSCAPVWLQVGIGVAWDGPLAFGHGSGWWCLVRGIELANLNPPTDQPFRCR